MRHCRQCTALWKRCNLESGEPDSLFPTEITECCTDDTERLCMKKNFFLCVLCGKSSVDVLFPHREQRKNSEISAENPLSMFCFPQRTQRRKRPQRTQRKNSEISAENPLCSLWETLCALCGKPSVLSVGNSSDRKTGLTHCQKMILQGRKTECQKS